MTDLAVSVVIPTFNRRDSLRRVIESVLTDPSAAEVVVVVDGSRDGSIELLEELARGEPRVEPVFIEHGGLNAAVQAGVEQAKSEVVLVLDDDLEAAPALASGHARHHEESSDLVVLGYSPVVIDPDASDETALTASLYGESYERSCRLFESHPEEILLHLYGGHMSLRRTTCLSIGVYSERFRERFHPDREFGIRCLNAGLVGQFDRALLARHHYVRSLSEFRADARSGGTATELLHYLHPDVLGPLDPMISAEGAPALGRWAIRLSRSQTLYRTAAAALQSVIRLLGRRHARSLQRACLKLLTRMEHQRGLSEALTRRETA